MPMCFNLFGELHGNPHRAESTAQFLFPAVQSAPVEVVFEWSPGRGSLDYTNDRTAFDVALILGGDGPKQVIGVETKYHEHALPEPKPKPQQLERRRQQLQHYKHLAERSGVFKPGWDALIGTDLEQLWKDHLLVLSMLNHGERWSAGRYVLVYPQRNVGFADATDRYREYLVDDTTFAAFTLEELLDSQVLHSDTTEAQFRERYLW